MASGLRWTQGQLDAHLKKQGLTTARSAGVPARATQTQGGEPKKHTVAKKTLIRNAIASTKQCRPTGQVEPGSFLEIQFPGVVLLSVNSLYKLSHFERIDYRRAWHQVVHDASLELLSRRSSFRAFDRFIIRAHRTTRRLADTDAKSGFLKYPIDGLRYANIIVDDSPAHFKDIFPTQSLGPPGLILRVEAVGEDYVAAGSQWAGTHPL